MHSHKRGVLDHLVGQIDAECVARKTEAEPDGTVLAAKGDVGVEVKDSAVHAEIGLVGHGFDVVLAVLDEAAVGQRPAAPQKTRSESDSREEDGSGLGSSLKRLNRTYSFVILHSVVPSS